MASGHQVRVKFIGSFVNYRYFLEVPLETHITVRLVQ